MRNGPDDSEEAARWRGVLFPAAAWNVYEFWIDTGLLIERPRSVTFPICACCGRIAWTWPHFEEPVPDGAVCDNCAADCVREAKGDG